MDILELPGLVTVRRRIDRNDQTYLIDAEVKEAQTDCPSCGAVGKLHKHDKRPKTFLDIPIRQYRVSITLKIQRFRCKTCEKVFNQDVPGMVPLHWMTYRCVRWIRERCLRDTFVHVAEHVGCSPKTVWNIAKEYIWQRDMRHRLYLPEWLGIDEIAVDGKSLCVLTDIGRRRPIDMLKDRLKPTVTNWLWEFRESAHLKGVTMDMCLAYKLAVRAVFPEVPIVVDKFHLLQMASRVNQACRD
jgi:transposase